MTRPKDTLFHVFLMTLILFSVLSSPLFAEEYAVPRVRPVESPDALLQNDSLVPPKMCIGPIYITCGEIATTRLDSSDCTGDDPGIRVDQWEFSGQAGSRVEINATSDDFDPVMVLFNPDLDPVAEDDD